MSSFSIQVGTSPEDLKPFLDLSKQEGWRTIAKCDNELFFAADPRSFFTGYKNGEKSSFVNMVTYADGEHCIFGSFLVYPEHRQQGHGSKIWEHAWSRIPKSCLAISVTAAAHMAPKLQDRYGLEPVWTDYMFLFDVQNVPSLSTPVETTGHIVHYSKVDFDSLVTYDTSVFGYFRKHFVSKMLSLSACEGWAAMNEDREIVGYCAVRESVVDNCGWVLGPWYANNTSVAQQLLQQAADFVAAQPVQFRSALVCVVPGVNKEAMRVARSLTKEAAGFTRMFARSKPQAVIANCENRVFGMSSACVG